MKTAVPRTCTAPSTMASAMNFCKELPWSLSTSAAYLSIGTKIFYFSATKILVTYSYHLEANGLDSLIHNDTNHVYTILYQMYNLQMELVKSVISID